MGKAANDPQQALEYRLARIEGLLGQVLDELQKKRRAGHARARSYAQSAYQSVVASGFEPTEDQVKAAKRAWARITTPKR